MKTISFYRYSYSFYRDGQDRPVVDAHIEGKFVQRLFITAEGGNELYTALRNYQRKLHSSHIRQSKWTDNGADDLFCKAFIKYDNMNGIQGLA